MGSIISNAPIAGVLLLRLGKAVQAWSVPRLSRAVQWLAGSPGPGRLSWLLTQGVQVKQLEPRAAPLRFAARWRGLAGGFSPLLIP